MRHFVLHAETDTLRRRIADDPVMGPSTFRFGYVSPYAEAFRTWLSSEAEIIDSTNLTSAQAASAIAGAVHG